MKDIKILGPGCPRCEQLFKVVEEAARNLGIEYKIEKVKDINDIIGYGVMVTPGLVVNGKVKTSGKVPDLEEAKRILSEE